MGSKLMFEKYNTKFDFEFHIWTDSISTMHGHDFYEFALCDGGEIIYYKNNNPMTIIGVKQAVFVTPEDRHSLIANKNEKNTRHIIFYMYIFHADETLDKLRNKIYNKKVKYLNRKVRLTVKG